MASESDDSACDPVREHASQTPSKKGVAKVPRKIHKAAREKLKRDHMNELFLELGKTLGLDHPNNGKASILRETIWLVGELLSQVDNLKKENETLLSESNYVTVERNELLDEAHALEAQMKSLQREIEERSNRISLDSAQPQCNDPMQISKAHFTFPLAAHASEPVPVVGPVFVMPMHHESTGVPAPFSETNMVKGISNVSRPQARYPSSVDSWPTHILSKEATPESCVHRQI